MDSEIDRMLFQMIATSRTTVSRSTLAKETGLSKMTIGRHISNLLEEGSVVEHEEDESECGVGRIPTSLHVSKTFPNICGILIKRSYMQVVIADISGRIINVIKKYYEEEMTADKLMEMMLGIYETITSRTKGNILGCGIALLGPVDIKKGVLLNTSNFYGISNVPIVDILHKHTGLPVYLLHDASAGALAEKIYGKGKFYENYIYIHVEEGIGLGYILNGQLIYNLSQYSGEIGHTSIDFDGPKCSCGNNGCLEVYANLAQMRKKIAEVVPYLPKSEFKKIKEPTWNDIVRLAAESDLAAIAALDEFCKYLSYAIVNMLTLMNFPVIILGYDSLKTSVIITRMIRNRIKASNNTIYNRVRILSSEFENAPLIGAVAAVAREVFEQKIKV